MKELEVVTKVDFDKQDIVTVAMAKIERLIRKKVRELKTSRDHCAGKIIEANKMISSFGENNLPKEMVKKLVQMEKGFKVAGISKIIGGEIKFYLTNKNDYELKISKKNESGDFTGLSISIMFKSVSYSKTQNKFKKEIEKVEEAKNQAITEGVTWKSKLSDMAAIERQMRAKVVEAELYKTAEGKALVDILTKNYEDTIKLLEM